MICEHSTAAQWVALSLALSDALIEESNLPLLSSVMETSKTHPTLYRSLGGPQDQSLAFGATLQICSSTEQMPAQGKDQQPWISPFDHFLLLLHA
jgi:hypothetical protein